MSAPPGVLDVKKLHGSGGMSELERKMQMMINEQEDEEEEKKEEEQKSELKTNSPLSKLPIEIIERIIHFTILPNQSQISQISTTDEILRSSIRLRNAYKLCLVSKQFDQLVRQKMYKQIHIAHRKIRLLLRAFEENSILASFVKDVHLSSHIWTSDVNEDMIAKLFVFIRPFCIRLRVGANESGLLPYLFHGYPHSEEDENEQDSLQPAALQVLHIIWRDEMDYDPRMIRAEEREEEEMLAETGEANSISARQTLITLFEHEQPERILQRNGTLSPQKERRNKMFSNLYHLTLDLYSQAQLDQLFVESGYFMINILPILSFLRIELPLSTLQCSVPQERSKDGRGKLAIHWPTKRFLFYGRIGGFEGVESDRVEEMKATVTENNRKLQLDERVIGCQDDDDQTARINLMPCMSILLRSLLTRFALNVHRNDLMLFSLLLNGSKVRESSWSTRSTVCAYILAQSLQRYLSTGKTDLDLLRRKTGENQSIFNSTIKSISFPLSQIQEQDLTSYWDEEWLKAEKEFDYHLPLSLGGGGLRQSDILTQQNGNSNENLDNDIRASLLLKWPAALDAFFRYAAMA